MRGDKIDPAEAAIMRGSAPRGPSDQELVNRMARGDQNALRELMLRHRGRVQRFTGRFLQDRDRIDDVVNDVFVAAWRQARAFEQRATVTTWLLAIAKFRAMSAHSEYRQREEAFDEAAAAKLGLSEFLCEAGYPSCVHEALVEHDGELRLCLGPLARRAFPFRSGVVQDQI